MSQYEDNVAFIVPLKWFARKSLGPIKAINPNYKFSIQWGPQSAPFSHGYDFAANPGNDFITNWWPRWVACVRSIMPGHKLRVEGFSNIIVDASKYFPLAETFAPASSPPPPPYDPTKPAPSPYPEPIYCLPCEDRVYTA